MNRTDINYIIEKLESYKPDNIYDSYNSEREKQDQRVTEVLDSIIAETKSDYKNNHMPASKELVLICKLDEEQMQRLKEQIESAKMSIEPVEESKWIKCSEKMPEPMRQVLFYDINHKDYAVGFYNNNCSAIQIGASLIRIGDKESYTHWRIPPEPPKED